jgi:hypothetical protein
MHDQIAKYTGKLLADRTRLSPTASPLPPRTMLSTGSNPS